VTVSGINYANDLSQWHENKPSDSLNQLNWAGARRRLRGLDVEYPGARAGR
jgi:hypothetical protein